MGMPLKSVMRNEPVYPAFSVSCSVKKPAVLVPNRKRRIEDGLLLIQEASL